MRECKVLMREWLIVRRTDAHDLKSNIQVLQKRHVSRKSESDIGCGGQKKSKVLMREIFKFANATAMLLIEKHNPWHLLIEKHIWGSPRGMKKKKKGITALQTPPRCC